MWRNLTKTDSSESQIQFFCPNGFQMPIGHNKHVNIWTNLKLFGQLICSGLLFVLYNSVLLLNESLLLHAGFGGHSPLSALLLLRFEQSLQT